MRSRLTTGSNVAPDVTPTDPPDEVSSDSDGLCSINLFIYAILLVY